MLLQRNFDYSLGDVVRWGNVKLKCTTAGKTNSTAIVLTGKVIGDTVIDGTCVWKLVDPNASGGASIGDWEASAQYVVGDFVVYNAVLYKCLTTNNDSVFTQSNWQAISEDGVTDWETNKRYAMYDLVMSSRNLYISLVAHTSINFVDDLASGKWMQINGGSSEGGGSSGKQITKLGVVAPLSVDIDIPPTELFNSPSVEVLKFAGGSENVSTNALTFNVGDGNKFNIEGVVASKSPLVTFDGVVRPNHNIKYKFGDAVKMVQNYYSESATIDLSDFKSVEEVTLV